MAYDANVAIVTFTPITAGLQPSDLMNQEVNTQLGFTNGWSSNGGLNFSKTRFNWSDGFTERNTFITKAEQIATKCGFTVVCQFFNFPF